MRHKRLSSIGLLLLGLGVTGAQAQTMYVRETGGSQTAYSVSNLQKMSFSAGNIIVSKTTGSPDTYPLSGIRFLNFEYLSTGNVTMDKQLEALQLFPNPATDVLNIQLPKCGIQTCTIQLLSIEGRVLFQEKFSPKSNILQLNVSALHKGLYICLINTSTTTQSARFIKQ